MTTINNDQSLIEKVGGIEMAREIIAGAHWENISYSNGSYYSHSCGKKDICLDDLRTAIAKHDEFKVGDFVVRRAGLDRELHKIEIVKDLDIKIFSQDMSHSFWAFRGLFKHATPEEIKAGRRLEAERHG